MRMKNENLNIELYQSWLGGLKILVLSLVFVAIGVALLSANLGIIGTVIAWISLIFGALGALTGIMQMTMRLFRVPWVAISDESIRTLVPIKLRYNYLMIADVKAFHLQKISDVTYICAEMKADGSMIPTSIGTHMFEKSTVMAVFGALNNLIEPRPKE